MKNNFIKSNPYVFPFLEFKNLANKDIKKIRGKEEIGLETIREILHKLKNKSKLQKKIISSISIRNSPSEKIFSLFTHPEVMFGELKMYQQNKDHWIKEFEKSIQNKQFNFSILGFPFKVANVLKTTRTMPDLGEIMSMNKLEMIAQIVEKSSNTPTTIYVVTEGVFAKFVGVPISTANKYARSLSFLAKQLGFTHLKFTPLQKMETYVKDFNNVFEKKVQLLEKQYRDGNLDVVKKIDSTYPIVLRIVNPKVTNLSELMDIYNYKIPDQKLSPKLLKLRKKVEVFALKSTFQYFTYLQMRDDVKFLEKELGHFIPLTVSPKPNRLGIIPISTKVKFLPHHGVSVYEKAKNEFNICYLIDLLRDKKTFKEVVLATDSDRAPFFYTT